MEKNDKVYVCEYRNRERKRPYYNIYCWVHEFINDLQYSDDDITKEDLEELIIIAKKRLKILEERNK